MDELTEIHGASSFPRGPGWLKWAEDHPGIVLLGTLVVATLLLARPTTKPAVEMDQASEEVPLFI